MVKIRFQLLVCPISMLIFQPDCIHINVDFEFDTFITILTDCIQRIFLEP